MTRDVEFWFDLGSPASYLAWTQMPALARETGATVLYRPMLLGGVFQATGNRSPMEVPAKSSYMKDELVRFARQYGVPYAHNPHFPINTLTLMRCAVGLQLYEPAGLLPFGDTVYRAIWVDGRNMNDPAVVAEVLQQAGFDAQEVLALAQQQQVKDALKAVTQEAIGRGVFGAPTFFVGDQMFWGQDRIDFVKKALT